MRSAELARLAGTTVRALRHYHRIGILAEPPRDLNGYRCYDVHDLIRVLRIRSLSSLGMSLERMRAVLDGDDSDGTGTLDELDRELAAQIERLDRQRGVIAWLRDHRAPPDFPPDLAPAFALFAAFDATGLPAELVSLDRDQAVLLAHLGGEDGATYLLRLYERIGSPELAPTVVEVARRFGDLGPDSPEGETEAVAELFVRVFGPLIAEFSVTDPTFDLGGSQLLDEHLSAHINDRQRRAIELFSERMGLAG